MGSETVVVESGANAITLVLAIIGIVLGVASLSWQAASFFLAGPRVKVQLLRGAVGQSGIVTGPIGAVRSSHDHLISQGFEEELLSINVVNHGRLAVSVERWHAVFENGMQFTQPRDPINADFPYRLQPHDSQTWHVRMSSLLPIIQASYASETWRGPHQRVWMSVTLAGDKTKRTKESLTLRV